MITITVQPDPLVTLDDMKTALGESGNDRNDLIEAFTLAAQGELDGPNGWVGISIAAQTAQIKASSFDEPEIRLAGGPFGTVTVVYVDSNGANQTLASGDYIVGADGVLSLAAGKSWPTLADRADGITVTYECGVDDVDDPRTQLMRTAIMLHVRMTLDGNEPDVSRRAIEGLVRPMWVPVA